MLLAPPVLVPVAFHRAPVGSAAPATRRQHRWRVAGAVAVASCVRRRAANLPLPPGLLGARKGFPDASKEARKCPAGPAEVHQGSGRLHRGAGEALWTHLPDQLLRP